MAMLVGCGGHDDDVDDAAQIRSTVNALQRDFAAGRMDEVCKATTTQVHTQVGSTGHAKPTECPKDMARFVELLKGGGGFKGSPRVTRIAVAGDRATASLEHPDGAVTGVPLRRDDGRWQVANLFGATTLPSPEPGAPRAFDTPGRLAAAVAGSPVAVSNAKDGEPCPRVEQSGDWPPTGGCVFPAPRGTIESSVRTPLGTFFLARCLTKSSVRLAGNGRVFLDDYEMAVRSDAPKASACGDVEACRNERSIATSWDGELRASTHGRFVGRLDVCMATCVGRFEGLTAVEVKRSPTGWRLELDDAPVGTGGLRLDGGWDLADGDGLRLSAAEKQRADTGSEPVSSHNP